MNLSVIGIGFDEDGYLSSDDFTPVTVDIIRHWRNPMMWITVFSVVLIIFLAVFFVLQKRAGGVPLLEVTVATDDGRTFDVSYEKRHPEMQTVEYIWMILYFAAKVLYNVAPTFPDEAWRLLQCIRLLGDTRLSDANISVTCGMPIVVAESSSTSRGRKVTAVLGYKNVMMRSIHTSLPWTWFDDQLLFSWLAIVQTSIPKLNETMLTRLQGSLKRMASIYLDDNVDPATMAALVQVPNQAFMDADVIV